MNRPMYGPASDRATSHVAWDLISITFTKWLERVWDAFGVNRMGCRQKKVEEEVERFIHLYDSYVANIDAIPAVCQWEIQAWSGKP